MTLLDRILARLRGATTPAPLRALFVHEDDIGDVELLPASVRGWCVEELARIEEFAAAHAAPDGLGWTEIHMGAPAPAGLRDLGLRADDAIAALRRVAPAYDTVEIGINAEVVVSTRATAFGGPGGGALMVHAGADGIVTGVDVVVRGGDGGLDTLLDAFSGLAAPTPLLAVAWNRGVLAALDDAGERAAFIRAIAG